MNIIELKALIDSEPANSLSTDEEVLSWCNNVTETEVRETLVTTRLMMNRLGANEADEILTKLENAASGNSTLARALKMLSPAEGGLDLGTPVAINMIRYLASVNAITQDESTALQSLAIYEVSPAQKAGLTKVRLGHIEKARAE